MSNLLISSRPFRLLLLGMVLLVSTSFLSGQCGNAYIAGVIDGPLSGGTPKAIQICAFADIADLSIYGVGSANNGGGTDGVEFTFPAVALAAGDCITVSNENDQFLNFFGCAPDYIDSAANVNGDDAIELFCNGTLEDLFGDPNVGTSGQCWDYLDGWAFNNSTSPNFGVFNCSAWLFSATGALVGETDNAMATVPYPGVVCPPVVCNNIEVDAYAFCSDAANDFVEGGYYIEVGTISGGTGSGNFTVTSSSSTLSYSGMPIVFGSFTHSTSGTGVQTITITDASATSCTTTIEVVETLCTDLDNDGDADNAFTSCNCIEAANSNSGGTIFAQSAPGTFSAGGSSGFAQHYILVNANGGTTTTIVSNSLGLFTGLPAGTYYVYAVNYKPGQAPNVVSTFTFGATIDLDALITNTAPYDTECYSACGPAAFDVVCGGDETNVACNGNLNVTVGALCDASGLGVDQFIAGNFGVAEQYELVITTQSGDVVDYKNETATTTDNVFNFINEELIYTVTDVCSGSTCWGGVTIEDKTPPQLDCDCPVGGEGGVYSNDCTLTCYDISLLEGPSNLPSDIADFVNNNIEDNCFNYTVVNVRYEDDRSDFGMCGGSLLRRTWIVTYTADGSAEHESVSCTREYAFRPLDLSTAITASGPVMSPAATEPSGIASAEGDAYAYPHIYVNGQAVGIDGTVCNIVSTYSDTNTEGCAPGCRGEGKILRSWTILDWCTSEVVDYLQVIKLEDNNAPLLSVGDDISTTTDAGSCELTMNLPAPVVLGDFCDSLVVYSVDGTSDSHNITGNASSGYSVSGLGVGTHEIYYSARDCCGNEAYDTLTITIKDETSPNAIAEEFNTVTVYGIDDNEVFGKITAASIDNGSYDNCSEVTLAIRREDDHCADTDDEWGETIHFCCADMNEDGWGEIRVELRVTDECGNTNTVWALVHIQDKSTDQLTCPEGMFRTCGDNIDDLDETGRPSFAGICGALDLNYEVTTVPATKPASASPAFDFDNDGVDDAVPPYDAVCGYGAMKRDFIEDGNVICTQYFVFTAPDRLDPNSIRWPSDVVVNCSSYSRVEPQFTSPTCGNVAVSVESDTFPNLDGYCYAVINTWTVVDWCTFDQTNGAAGKYTNTQEVKVSDSSAPIIVVEQDMTFDLNGNDCELDNINFPLTAWDMDGCPVENISWEIEIDYYKDGTIDVVLTENSFPDDTINMNLTDVPASKSGHDITFHATDDCGNRSTISSTIRVNDVRAPSPYCIVATTGIDTIRGTFELWAVDFDGGATDNCTGQNDLRFTFSDLEPPSSGGYYDPVTGASLSIGEFQIGDADSWDTGNNSAGRIFSVDDLNLDGSILLTIYVWDECGNRDFCVISPVIRPMDVGSRAVIQGTFATELGLMIDEVETQLSSSVGGNALTMMTDHTGEYAFMDNVMHTDYVVKGERDFDYLNGVSTLDLIQIQRHVLGQSLLDSPYKMIAADINGDRRINGSDLVELRKLILGVNEELQTNDSWKFVNAAQQLTLMNPWIYQDSIAITNLSNSMMNEDFIGVKIGDIDNTNIPNQLKRNASSRSKNLMLLQYNDRSVTAGEEFSVELSASESELYGYQFELDFENLIVKRVEGRDFATENNYVTDNSLAISYNSDFLVDGEESFITIHLTAEADGLLSEMMTISSDLKAEGYVGKYLAVKDIQLATADESGFRLYQNRPNPFSEMTVIEFDIPKRDEVTLSLYDITGKIFKVVSQEFGEGHHAFEIRKTDLGTSGVVYYRLESGGFTSIKQMIIIE